MYDSLLTAASSDPSGPNTTIWPLPHSAGIALVAPQGGVQLRSRDLSSAL